MQVPRPAGSSARPEAPASASFTVLGRWTTLREPRQRPGEAPAAVPGAGGGRAPARSRPQAPLTPRRGWKRGTGPPQETEARCGTREEAWSGGSGRLPRPSRAEDPAWDGSRGFPGTLSPEEAARRGCGLRGGEHRPTTASPAGASGRGRAICAFRAKFRPRCLCPSYSLDLRNLPAAVNLASHLTPAQ